MGWTAGTGLGAEGEGRVAPVEALLFAQGAGLGSTRGVDMTKYQGADGRSAYGKDMVSWWRDYCDRLLRGRNAGGK